MKWIEQTCKLKNNFFRLTLMSIFYSSKSIRIAPISMGIVDSPKLQLPESQARSMQMKHQNLFERWA